MLMEITFICINATALIEACRELQPAVKACTLTLQGYGAQVDDEMIFMQTAEPFTDAPLSTSRAPAGGDGMPMSLDAGRPEPGSMISPGMDPFQML